MDSEKVNLYLVTIQDKIPAEDAYLLQQKLLAMSDGSEFALMAADLKSPVVSLLLSIFLGVYGIDRFYIGDTTLGVLKLITCGGMGIWSLIDIFLIMGATKRKNAEKLMQMY